MTFLVKSGYGQFDLILLRQKDSDPDPQHWVGGGGTGAEDSDAAAVRCLNKLLPTSWGGQ